MDYVPGPGHNDTTIDHAAGRRAHGRNVSELSRSVNTVGSIVNAGLNLAGGSVLSTSRNVPGSTFAKTVRSPMVPKD